MSKYGKRHNLDPLLNIEKYGCFRIYKFYYLFRDSCGGDGWVVLVNLVIMECFDVCSGGCDGGGGGGDSVILVVVKGIL